MKAAYSDIETLSLLRICKFLIENESIGSIDKFFIKTGLILLIFWLIFISNYWLETAKTLLLVENDNLQK